MIRLHCANCCTDHTKCGTKVVTSEKLQASVVQKIVCTLLIMYSHTYVTGESFSDV